MADGPELREAKAAYIADQLRCHQPPVLAADILRYLERFGAMPDRQKAKYRIEKVDA